MSEKDNGENTRPAREPENPPPPPPPVESPGDYYELGEEPPERQGYEPSERKGSND